MYYYKNVCIFSIQNNIAKMLESKLKFRQFQKNTIIIIVLQLKQLKNLKKDT